MSFAGSWGKNILERAFRTSHTKRETFVLTAMETMDFNPRIQAIKFQSVKDHFHSSIQQVGRRRLGDQLGNNSRKNTLRV